MANAAARCNLEIHYLDGTVEGKTCHGWPSALVAQGQRGYMLGYPNVFDFKWTDGGIRLTETSEISSFNSPAQVLPPIPIQPIRPIQPI